MKELSRIIEIWADIPNYEGLYKASSFGRFKALDKTYYCGNPSTKRFKKEHILKYGYNRDKYLTIAFSKNGVTKTFLAHKLTALLFVDNPENKSEINHYDGNKQNNMWWNLRWSTRSENIIHAFDTGLMVSLKLGEHGCAKIVLDTQTGIYYTSAKEAAIAKNIKYHTCINNLCGVIKNSTGLIYV